LEDQGIVPTEEKMALEMIRRTGLDLSKVIIADQYGRATSTMDEAIAFKKWLSTGNPQVKSVIIVTSWPHASRAGWTFEKVLAGSSTKIEVVPVESVPFTKENWWQSERGLLFVFEEYIKYARYIIKYAGRSIG
jgi:uncharacterized SAM-binding protein YcdF (DUF218 family)